MERLAQAAGSVRSLNSFPRFLLRPQAQVSSRLPGESDADARRLGHATGARWSTPWRPLSCSQSLTYSHASASQLGEVNYRSTHLLRRPAGSSVAVGRAWSIAEVWPAWSVQLKLTRYEFGLPQQQLPPSTRQSVTTAQTTTISPAEL